MTTSHDMVGDRLSRMAPLTIPDDYARWVAHWLDILGEHAETFNAITLPDEIEPATVFRA